MIVTKKDDEIPGVWGLLSGLAQNWKGIAKYSAMGLAAGGAYGAFKTTTAETGIDIELDPKPLAFSMDRWITRLFYLLGKYRDNQEQAYVDALIQADLLLQLERTIVSDKHAEPHTLDLAKTHRMACLGCIILLRERCTDPNHVAIINHYKDLINKVLLIHLDTIGSLCDEYLNRGVFEDAG